MNKSSTGRPRSKANGAMNKRASKFRRLRAATISTAFAADIVLPGGNRLAILNFSSRFRLAGAGRSERNEPQSTVNAGAALPTLKNSAFLNVLAISQIDRI